MVRVEDVTLTLSVLGGLETRILSPPADYPYGERQYTAEDLAVCVDILPVDCGCRPEEWGGTSVQL